MEIRQSYKFEYEKDGIIMNGTSAGFLPDYALRVLETFDILYPSSGMDLKRISTGEVNSCFILLDGDTIENYEEVEREKIVPKRRERNAE